MKRYISSPTGITIAVFFTVVFSLPLVNGWCGWFQQSDDSLLRQALESDNPKKVGQCLDTFIKKQNYSAILQIKQHAKRRLQIERNALAHQEKIEPEVIKKRLAPWKQIEQKADQFFRKTTVQHDDNYRAAP
jgi:hypothetical protein